MADAGAGRSYSPGNYVVDIDGYQVAFIKKFEGMSMEADIVANDLGPDNMQAKHVANIKWTPGKISVGAGMGKGMYEWIKQSFDKAYAPKNGTVTVANFDFKAQSQLTFQSALITSVGFPALKGESKDAIYLDVEFQPEIVRWAKGDNKVVGGTYGVKQKAWLASNFRFEMGGLPCARVASVDAFTWKCEVSPDQVGITREPTYHPAKVTVPDIKISISMADYEPWQAAAKKWFVDGEHLAANEMQGSITLLGPDMKKEIGRIDLQNCGFKKFSKQAYESNKTGIARFDVEFYIEGIKFLLTEVDA
jgi:hypothetical protein